MTESEHAQSEQPEDFLPGDFTGTVCFPVAIGENGKPVRQVREYVRGECVRRYDTRVRTPR